MSKHGEIILLKKEWLKIQTNNRTKATIQKRKNNKSISGSLQ